MTNDRFNSNGASPLSPADAVFEITPSDAAELEEMPRALYIGGGGDLAIRDRYGSTVVLRAVPAGTLLPIRPVAVLATGTTADGIVGLL